MYYLHENDLFHSDWIETVHNAHWDFQIFG